MKDKDENKEEKGRLFGRRRKFAGKKEKGRREGLRS